MRNNKNPRLRSAKGERYKVTNWKEYNRSLKNRGSLTMWISDDVISSWYFQGGTQQGAQFEYSDLCIEGCLMVRKVYHLPYRQTEGFIDSIFKLLSLDIKVPDYSIICRRSKKLEVNDILNKQPCESLHIVMDSTGLKVYGEGEWKVRQHGYSKYRTWRKIHIAVDPETGLIQAAELTTNSVDDAAMVKPVLEKIEGKIKKFSGDGAYDRMKVYEVLEKEKINPIIPPKKNAKISKHGNRKGRTKPRDRALRYIRKHGRKKWKIKSKYHKRSLAETTMFRYKSILGGELKARTFDRQCVEAMISCKILNRMTEYGMPISKKIN